MSNLFSEAKNFLQTSQGQKVEQMFESKTGIDVNKYLGGGGSNANTASSGNYNNDGSEYQPQHGSSGSSAFPTGEAQYGQGNNNSNQYSAQNQSFGNSGGEAQSYYGGNQQSQGGNYGQNQGGNYGQNQGETYGQNQGGNGGYGGNGGSGGRERRQSAYEGYDQGDSSASGGYGANQAGDSFSRSNQMGADQEGPFSAGGRGQGGPHGGHGGPHHGGYQQSGTSTPGYATDEDEGGRRHHGGGPHGPHGGPGGPGGGQGMNPYGNNDQADGRNPYHEQGRQNFEQEGRY